jgi:3-oxoacyl-[acyl-carrier protein] reductase
VRRTALVTGAGKNIGAAIALDLAKAGNDVVLHVRQETDASRLLAATLRSEGVEASVIACDLTDRAARAALIEVAAGCDIIVNNVALRPIVPFLETDDEHWREVFDVTFHVPVELSRAALPRMIENNWGRIISLIGVRAQQGAPKRASSSSAKHALIGFTRSLANEFGVHGVTVNAVSPGTIVVDRDTTGESARLGTRGGLSALDRFGTSEEVSAAVAFLASEKAGYITGQVLGVNGGELMTN